MFHMLLYTLLHIDSQQVFAGLVSIILFDVHFVRVSPSLYIFILATCTYMQLSTVSTLCDRHVYNYYLAELYSYAYETL